jgi:hypothetical protein
MQLRQQKPRVINTNKRRQPPVIAALVVEPKIEEPVAEPTKNVEEVEQPINQQRKNKPYKLGFNKNEEKNSNN